MEKKIISELTSEEDLKGLPPPPPIKPLLNHTNSQGTTLSSVYSSATQPSRTRSYKCGELRVAAQYRQWVKHVLGSTWERKERILGNGFWKSLVSIAEKGWRPILLLEYKYSEAKGFVSGFLKTI